MVLPTQMAVCGVGRQDGHTGLLVDTRTGLQQLGVGVELTVRQQEDALPGSHCFMACWQTLLRQVVIKVFFHFAFKVFLVPFPFATMNNRIVFEKDDHCHRFLGNLIKKCCTYICSSSSDPIMSL